MDEEIDTVNGNNGRNYLSTLHTLSQKLVDSASQFKKEDGKNCRLLDKPNIHRLIELSVTSLPLVGHGRILSELVFEMVHFFFKKWFEDNPNPDSHLTAVDKALSRTWCCNVYVSYNMYKHGADKQRPLAKRNLLRLFFGEKVFKVSANSEQFKGLFDQFFKDLDHIFKPPVRKMLEDCVPSTFIESIQEYKCYRPIKNVPFDDVRLCWGLELISEHIQENKEVVKSSSRFFEHCSLLTIDKYKMGFRSYPYKTVRPGTAVQILVHYEDKAKNIIISKETRNIMERSKVLIAVLYILQLHGHIWIIGLRLIKEGCFFLVSKEDITVVRMSIFVQRVGLVHQCSSSCKIQSGSMTAHNSNLLDGGRFKVLDRPNGLPPFFG